VSAALRLVTDAEVSPRAETADVALRPVSFDDYIGQREVIENLKTSVRAAKRGGWQLDHTLFTGPKGLGKTSIAQVVAVELGAKLRVTSAPAITHKGQLAALLASLQDGDVLFIDEIHRLAVTLQETLYTAMEDRVLDMAAGTKILRLPLAKFTLLGATTHAGLLSAPMRDRFGYCHQLSFYSVADLTTIVLRSAQKLGVAIDDEGAAEIARRSRGTPRLANRLLRRVRDFITGSDSVGGLVPRRLVVGGPLATVALDRLGIDSLGLDALDRAYLGFVSQSKAAVGVEAIAVALSEQRQTIEDAIEPFLVQLGFVSRSRKGRVATEAGMQHLTTAL
jgi:Holliday junction DNA helicase RuvB